MARREIEQRRPLPPYIAFKTLQGFVEKLKETVVPERIDPSVLRSYSGSVARQLTTAMKYLGLVIDDGRPTDKLNRLVQAHGTPDWEPALSEVLLSAYSPVLGDLNLAVATPGQLREKFQAAGAESEVLQKVTAFFVTAAQSANISISPHIVNRHQGRTDKGRPRPRRAGGKEPADKSGGEGSPIAMTGAAGTARFSFPIPDKAPATIFLPTDVTTDDWEMVDAMVRAYVQRRDKSQK